MQLSEGNLLSSYILKREYGKECVDSKIRYNILADYKITNDRQKGTKWRKLSSRLILKNGFWLIHE